MKSGPRPSEDLRRGGRGHPELAEEAVADLEVELALEGHVGRRAREGVGVRAAPCGSRRRRAAPRSAPARRSRWPAPSPPRPAPPRPAVRGTTLGDGSAGGAGRRGGRPAGSAPRTSRRTVRYWNTASGLSRLSEPSKAIAEQVERRDRPLDRAGLGDQRVDRRPSPAPRRRRCRWRAAGRSAVPASPTVLIAPSAAMVLSSAARSSASSAGIGLARPAPRPTAPRRRCRRSGRSGRDRRSGRPCRRSSGCCRYCPRSSRAPPPGRAASARAASARRPARRRRGCPCR